MSLTGIPGIAIVTVGAMCVGSSACIPVHITEPASPVVMGRYYRSDGTPAAGTRVAVSSHWDDQRCTRATQRATTDSAGEFTLPSTTTVRRWVVIFPPIERFTNGYHLCAGADDSVVRNAFDGWVPLYNLTARDTVSCLEWAWQGRTQVTCARASDRALQSGGHWADGADSGFYRLIAPGKSERGKPGGVYLQWVARPASGRDVVKRMVELPLAPKLIDVQEATLAIRSIGPSCVRVRSSGDPAHWYTLFWDVRVDASFELGAPGVMRRIRLC